MNKKTPNKKRLRSEADRLWYNKYLKQSCEVCGNAGILQAHHFYYRSSFAALRYSKENHITLCRSCHFLLHHQDPKKIEEKIIERRGQKWFKELSEKSKEKYYSFQTVKYYKDTIEKLKKEQTGEN